MFGLRLTKILGAGSFGSCTAKIAGFHSGAAHQSRHRAVKTRLIRLFCKYFPRNFCKKKGLMGFENRINGMFLAFFVWHFLT